MRDKPIGNRYACTTCRCLHNLSSNLDGKVMITTLNACICILNVNSEQSMFSK